MSTRELDRRRFCGASCGALVTLSLAACGSSRDAGALPDGGEPDLRQSGSCGSGLTAGPATAIFANQVVSIMDADGNEFFVGRAPGGALFGLSASCPHACCDVAFDAGTQSFMCPCHGSTFAYDGTNTGGPANGTPLQSFSVCVDGEGNAVLELTQLRVCHPTPGGL